MPTSVNINGTYRKVWPSRVCVDGVWRPDDSYVKVNGVWRKTHEHNISIDTIIGVRIIYTRDAGAKSSLYPKLRSTKELPVRMSLTGETRGHMDLIEKGVVFEYETDPPYLQGICMYRGIMYIEFADGTLLPINARSNPNLWDAPELYGTSIRMDGYEFYESYGFWVNGWNTVFHKKHHLKDYDPDSDFPYKMFRYMNNYEILPKIDQDEEFSSDISIGIAREVFDSERNMAGSYGVLDHSYKAIYVNGEAKPFVIEIYH